MPAPTKAGVDERRDISLPCKKHKSKKREKGDVRIMSKIFSRLKPGLRPLPPGMTLRNKDVLLATWFGSGLLRPASGTIGTLAALPFGYLIQHFGGMPALALAAALAFWFGAKAADRYGKKSGQPDDQAIVIDEVAGVWIAALPAGDDPGLWFVAFVFFRILDVYKPWPASFFDKRKGGGFDVMMDDVVAGAYAFLGTAGAAVSVLLKL